jgi:NAD(P)-dependent dehydrogenase (short-subunit alcohol dehydrogenase family)
MSDPTPNLEGKTVLITGATAGIGEISARALARMGARVVIVGRSAQKCEATVESIRRESGNPDVEALVADLSSMSEVRRLAGEFLSKYDRLDVLLNNAGALFATRTETADGFERTFALNHLAYFLLTNLLIDRLKASAPSRIVNVASEAHRFAPGGLNFNDLQTEKRYRGFRVYGASKLANILFTRELDRRLEGTGVTANCLHPGFVATNFTSGNGMLGWVFRRMASLFAIPPEQGAQTSIYLASSPEVAGVSGGYFDKCKPREPQLAGRNDKAARTLWEVSEELTGLKAVQPA